jgi:hypothetical protein
MNQERAVTPMGSNPHKAIFDITISFRTELETDDRSARAVIDALPDYIRARVPGSDEPEVSIKQK